METLSNLVNVNEQMSQQLDRLQVSDRQESLPARYQLSTAIKIPPFSGLPQEDVDDWLFACQHYFSANRFEPNKYTVIAAAHLAGHARAWWKATINSLNPDNSDYTQELKVPMWAEFVDLILKQFRKAHNTLRLQEELRSLKQEGSIMEYISRFSELEVKLADMSGETKLYFFIAGLKPNVKRELTAKQPVDLRTAMNLSAIFEDPYSQASISHAPEPDMMELSLMTPRCYNCESIMHLVRDCPHPMRRNRNNSFDNPRRGQRLHVEGETVETEAPTTTGIQGAVFSKEILHFNSWTLTQRR